MDKSKVARFYGVHGVVTARSTGLTVYPHRVASVELSCMCSVSLPSRTVTAASHRSTLDRWNKHGSQRPMQTQQLLY